MTEEDQKELLEALENTLIQGCGRGSGPNYRLDSGALSFYADGIRVLAKHGRVNITEDFGRMVIAVFHDQQGGNDK